MAESWIDDDVDLHLSGPERPAPTTLVVGAMNACVDGIEMAAAAVDRIAMKDLMV